MRSARKHTQGQIAPVALFGVLIASAVLVLMYNNGQKVTEKSQVANAADAAAYSGAVWTARHLNFMAYTNRAMIANHVAVGHFVSYTSWIRYVDTSIGAINKVARWIPYVGQYTSAVKEVSADVREITEKEAKIAIPAIDALNATYRAAQVEAQGSLALLNLNALMTETARAYDPLIKINDEGDLGTLPTDVSALIQAQLYPQLAAVPAFVKRYGASDDNGRLSELVKAGLSDNADERSWIQGNRGWHFDQLLVEIHKDGSAAQSQSSTAADWKANDKLRVRTPSLFGWGSWKNIGQPEKASAREFSSNYQGVPAYYNVKGDPGTQSLVLTAIATKMQTAVRTADLLGMTAKREPLAAAASAKIEFHRPTDSGFLSLGTKKQEYANLFNPFWDAHLAPGALGL
jgi:Putative Flp pilus-assembly TadE/G-like